MKTLASSVALACALITAPVVMAEGKESDWEASANVALASDYVFRGISQTDEEPAIQGGFDIAHASGFYIGTWASNIDFDSDASTEIDVYTGYAFDVAEGVSLDLGVIYYIYPSEEDDLNYLEWAASLGFGGATVGIVFSDEYLGDGGEDFFYYYADYSLEVSGSTSLDLHVGYNDGDQDLSGDNDDSYVDYSVGVSTKAIGLGFSLALTGTDIDDDVDGADERLVFTISKEL